MAYKDPELVKVIDDAIANSASHIEALDKVIAFQKEHRGLQGFHVSAPLDILTGQRKGENPAVVAENMAKDVLMIKRECALGNTKDVTGTKL